MQVCYLKEIVEDFSAAVVTISLAPQHPHPRSFSIEDRRDSIEAILKDRVKGCTWLPALLADLQPQTSRSSGSA
jgi:hypothetical protein